MLILTPIEDPLTEPNKATYGKALKENNTTIIHVIEQMEEKYETFIKTPEYFELLNAQDENGNIYSNIRLIPTFCFTRNGDRYIGTEGIAINYDAFLKLYYEYAKTI